MANYSFRPDLVLGNEGENIIKEYLISKGLKFVSANNDNKYDLIMDKNGSEVSYEIKTDVLCTPSKDTGNMFVEFKCRNKPSGVETSIADWFVTYFKHLGEIWFIKTSDLKTLVNNNHFKIITNGGDKGSNTHGYLINKKLNKEHFKVYEI